MVVYSVISYPINVPSRLRTWLSSDLSSHIKSGGNLEIFLGGIGTMLNYVYGSKELPKLHDCNFEIPRKQFKKDTDVFIAQKFTRILTLHRLVFNSTHERICNKSVYQCHKYI